ncbi:DUF4384 domain-containing protein [Rhodoblastus acidophilus]|uniref:DUF4384 domain-containing protein n=1 Tax=Candidatus Rhodoblastus alkanivorans TaxID=2954117 RepID=A0ABS9Z795_9HYPH|nr:DUF4384 domain-containing protein [Candidatus Rhodoblastus alkanivorans]MCI4678287.1 DUF4384 domain-containing protein [Candidatus Rhodoblastus alkanivorans]MCI4683545.1 DUF4384 domain-containing protein [Candidatus Rhodoblastus alkanivorans]MDI4640860.1 DUF4384 domain-containing protein [Rhodoblastus acidophilus]
MRVALSPAFLLCALLLGAPPISGAAQAQEPQDPGGAVRGVRIDAWPAPSRALNRPQVKEADVAALPASPPLKNKVGLAFDFAPAAQLSIGSKISFRIRANKTGYVVIVDVDAHGKTSQIYPNALSAAEGEKSAEANRIQAGVPIVIPAADSKTYEFIASPPVGVGMTMAIFSETPLQVVDLPDVPANLIGRPDEATFLGQAAQSLRFIPTGASDEFTAPDLSFAAQFYVVR